MNTPALTRSLPLFTIAVALAALAGPTTSSSAQGQSQPDAPALPSSTIQRAGRAPAAAPATSASAQSAPAAPSPTAAAAQPAAAPQQQKQPEQEPQPQLTNAQLVAATLPGWTAVQAPPANAPLISIVPGAFPPRGTPSNVNMHFATHGSRVAGPVGQGNAIPNGQAWWYGQTVGPVATPSDNVYSYFAYTPPESPLGATGVDPKFWAQDGTGFGQYGWDPYNMGGTSWVGGFD